MPAQEAVPPPPRPPARGWYFVGLGLICIAIAIAATGFSQMNGTIEGMQRVVMPGSAPIILSAGRTILYFEERAVINGREITAATDQVSCALLDARDQPIVLEGYTGKLSYSLGDFKGRAVFETYSPSGGPATLRCEASGEVSIAIGGGIGAAIVVSIVGGIIPFMGGLAVLLVIFLKRRGWAKRTSSVVPVPRGDPRAQRSDPHR